MRPTGAFRVSSRVTAYELFMLSLSIWAILSLAAQATFALSDDTSAIIGYGDTLICGIFLFDFLHSLAVSTDRWRYMRTWGWIDLLSSIPAVDTLRVGRIARIFRVGRVIRVAARGCRVAEGALAVRVNGLRRRTGHWRRDTECARDGLLHPTMITAA